MEPQDAEVGYWVKDALYTFTPGKDMHDGKREYLVDREEQKKIRTCKNWASKYFEAKGGRAPGKDQVIYRNGRPYYFRSTYPIDRPFSITKPLLSTQRSILCDRMKIFNGKQYDLSSLICTQFANRDVSADWEEIFELMKGCTPLSECDPCTKIGYKIAKSLIKIAALRIFADPEQSIMELPVNSLDAYSSLDATNRKIGKFGMGFFSVLYWLVGHPLREMIIHSFAKDSRGAYQTYKIVIKEVNGVLSFSLTTYPGSEITTTGFRVFLDCSKDKLTNENIVGFEKQLGKLKFSSGAKIHGGSNMLFPRNGDWWHSFDTSLNTVINDDKSKNDVICVVRPEFILVEDYAIGVPLEVALGSLFVPSISTKTIQLSESSIVEYKNQSKYIKTTEDQPSKLMILVGGIAVASFEFEKSKGSYYVIHMPYNTRLPVSRDDIVPTADTLRILKESIAIIFRDLIDLTKNTKRDVATFQKLLTKYKEFTPNADNQLAVTQAMKDFFEANRTMLVPKKHKDLYNIVMPDSIVSREYDALSVERWLDENVKSLTDIWHGIKVVVVEYPGNTGLNITNGDLVNYLFVSKRYKDSLGKEWINSITSSYFHTKLYPFASAVDTKEYEKYDRWTNVVGSMSDITTGVVEDRIFKMTRTGKRYKASEIIKEKETLTYLFAVLSKFEGLSIYFDMTARDLLILLEELLCTYIIFGDRITNEILGELMKKFSSFIGNQTYGASKNMLSVYSALSPRLSGYLSNGFGDLKKKKMYLLDHMICAIRAVKEGPQTFFDLTTLNNPHEIMTSYYAIPDLPKIAWDLSANLTEFTALLAGVGVQLRYQTNIEKEVLEGFLAHSLQDIRNKRMGLTDLVSMYEVWENKSFSTAKLTLIYLRKQQVLGQEWANTISNTGKIGIVADGYSYARSDDYYKMSLSSLIQTLFKEEMPDAKGLPGFLKDVAKKEVDKTPLQIIEIAVNEGTVKPFVEATMTELVQNSIDAIREYNPTNKDIFINLSRVANSSDLVLSITDYVGMSSDAFVYVGIPFLSTKTPSEIVTGEMGSGFFNAYRDSKMVIIESVKNGVVRRTYDTPIRDSKGRVVDIKKEITIYEKKTEPNMTKIDIVIPTSSRLDEVGKIAKVDYTARNILGLSLIPGRINYGNENVSIPKILAGKIGHFELYFTDPEVSPKHESYLLTKGVPFAPLAPYFKQELSQRVIDIIDKNFIVNITHGGYTPVQTRTRINIPAAVLADFRRVAIYTAFVTMVREFCKGHKKYMLDHVDSKASADQLKFAIYNVELFSKGADETHFLKYTNFFGQPTIASLINECIDILGSELYATRKQQLEEKINTYNSPYPEVNVMVRSIVTTWLLNKNKNTAVPEKEEKGKVKKNVKGKYIWVDPDTEPDQPDPEIEKILKAWVETFLKLSANAGVNSASKRVPVVKAVKSLKNISKAGWYDPKDNTITINTYTWDEVEKKQLIKNITVATPEDVDTKLGKNKLWDSCFGYRFPCAVLPHELEHYRRGQSHDGGGHDSTRSILFTGDEIDKNRTFDQSANAVFQQILSRGFYSEFLKSVKARKR